ncbi:hypothetical protein Q4F19_05440 [Sphingomonas sp. BIUV-7]|uniref:Uncharacterized protein n=1 Tax=Sphingomonas natans TaxID=3063330 RepID=A0ABT8Y7D7_9SPHN|nr:hypothetical protein [Sphingomonas sp. BIUV-7]MDO6413818.1 hypothetical protein [Sphingomonas sp. BIUV-7]
MSFSPLDMDERVTWRRDNEPECVRRGGLPILTEGAGTLFEAIGQAILCPSENRGFFRIWRGGGEEISGGRLDALVNGVHRRAVGSR